MSDWRKQLIHVEGRSFILGSVTGGRLYHGTTAYLELGSIISVRASSRIHKQSPDDAVCITSDANRAHYWARKAREACSLAGQSVQVFVYEVTPSGEVSPWRVSLDNYGKNFVLWEGRCQSAEVVRVIPMASHL